MAAREKMESLAADLGARPFDLMMVGDGSGSTAAAPCGWFVTLYDRHSGGVTEHWGGTGGGTNNLAELDNFVHTIASFRHTLWARHAAGVPVGPQKVFIVSDSEVTVRCGNRQYARRANAPLWASIEWFESKGYAFEWKWVPRNSNEFSARADRVAKQIRKLMQSPNQG